MSTFTWDTKYLVVSTEPSIENTDNAPRRGKFWRQGLYLDEFFITVVKVECFFPPVCYCSSLKPRFHQMTELAEQNDFSSQLEWTMIWMVIEYMPENKNSHTHVNTKISLLSSNWEILLNENGCGQRVFSTSGSFSSPNRRILRAWRLWTRGIGGHRYLLI